MEKTKSTIKKYYKQIILTAILSSLSFFSVYTNKTYNFNPFFIITILISLKISPLSLAFVLIANASGSFIVSVPYGLEITLHSLIFASLLFLPRIKQIASYDFIPIALYYIVTSIVYLIQGFSWLKVSDLVFSLLATMSFYLSINNHDDKNKYIKICHFLSLSFIPFLFHAYSTLETMAIFITTYYLLSHEKEISWRFTYITLLTALLYFRYLWPIENIFYMVAITIIGSLISNFYISGAICVALTCLASIIKYPSSFWIKDLFLSPIIAYLIGVLTIPHPSLIQTMTLQNTDQQKISDIENYLELIATTAVDPVLEKRNLEENLSIKPCQKCLKQSTCTFKKDLSQNLPKAIYKPLKDSILKDCPNGSKLVYRYRVVRDMVSYELKSDLIKQEQTKALNNIVAPLKSICHPELNVIDKSTLNNALNKDIIKTYDSNKLITYQALNEKDKKIICETANKNIEQNYKYDYLLHHFTYTFIDKKISSLKSDYSSHPLNELGGDLHFIYSSPTTYECILIDAMGHDKASYQYAKLALRLLNLNRFNHQDIESRLNEVNTVLRYQNSGDNYITLDLLIKGQNEDEYILYKLGSAPSYLLSDNKIFKIENQKPPLGILETIDIEPYILKIKSNDKLLLLTDGFNIEGDSFFSSLPQKYTAEDFYQIYKNSHTISDDTSIVILNKPCYN